jgi:predicted phosphodiesterase
MGVTMKKKMNTQEILVITDTHIPWDDERTLWPIEQYMMRHELTEMIHLGDLMDLGCISHWNEGMAKTMAEQTQFEDDLAMTELALDRWLKILRANNKNAKLTWIEGNHENWAKQAVEKTPSLEKTFNLPLRLSLKQRGVAWVPFWTDHRNVTRRGKANFIHGEYTNDAHAKKTVLQYGCNVYYGHNHDLQEHSIVHRGDDSTLVGKSLGCTCRYDMPYTKNKPNKWQQAFAHFTILPDGMYTEKTVRIFKNRFATGGFVYDGRDKTVTKSSITK